MNGQHLLARVVPGGRRCARGRAGVRRLVPGNGGKDDRYRGEQKEPHPHLWYRYYRVSASAWRTAFPISGVTFPLTERPIAVITAAEAIPKWMGE